MIKHIVVYKLKENTEEIRANAKAVLTSMIGVVPDIIDLNVGFDFVHSERSFDMALIVTLADKEALTRYATNEYHCTVVKPHMHAIKEQSISIDYEE